jgi:hypothetical protein
VFLQVRTDCHIRTLESTNNNTTVFEEDQKSNLTLSMIKPPTISGQVKDFWSVYSILISILEAGFAGALSTYVFWLSKKRNKEDFCHQLKYPR